MSSEGLSPGADSVSPWRKEQENFLWCPFIKAQSHLITHFSRPPAHLEPSRSWLCFQYIRLENIFRTQWTGMCFLFCFLVGQHLISSPSFLLSAPSFLNPLLTFLFFLFETVSHYAARAVLGPGPSFFLGYWAHRLAHHIQLSFRIFKEYLFIFFPCSPLPPCTLLKTPDFFFISTCRGKQKGKGL